VAVDAAGDVFVADSGNNAIEEILASNGSSVPSVSGFSVPPGVAVDAAGDVFVADPSSNESVVEILPDSTIVPIGYYFNNPQGVAVDAAGDVFVADSGNNQIVELTSNTNSALPSPQTGTTVTTVSHALTGLTPNTVYYDRVVATGPGEMVVGSVSSFTTPRATPVITWPTPNPIATFTPITTTQLDATADTAGSFTYSPAPGTLLPAGTQTLKVTFTPNDTVHYTTVTKTVSILVLAPGHSTVVGSQLFAAGGTTANDKLLVAANGSGIQVISSLNGTKTTTTYSSLTAITVYAGRENVNIQAPATLAVNFTISAGNGSDNLQLGSGNNVVTLGGGNDSVKAGNGNNVVTLGNGTDRITLGDGNNVVTLGNGIDSITVGNGNNVIVEGNDRGSPLLRSNVHAGNGDNLIVGGLGPHIIMAGNGSNILIDGNAALTQPGDTLAQVLSDWMHYGAVATNVANIRARLAVTDNASTGVTLDAGTGPDWFWETYAQNATNRKVNDLLN
jgi:hypothetical protein